MKFAFLFVALLSGCYHYPHLHNTPRHHVPIHINSDVSVPEATVDEWVDLRVDEWISRKVDWGCEGLSDGFLEQLCVLTPVIVYAGYLLPASEPNAVGLNIDGANPKIEITIDYPASFAVSRWDPYYVTHPIQNDPLYGFGMRELPHEWTHSAIGAWHPQ